MSLPGKWIHGFASIDKFLLFAVAASLLSGAHGITWGRYGCLNPDELAGRSLKSSPPLHPGSFDKPPLFSYLNKFLVNEPVRPVAYLVAYTSGNSRNIESVYRQCRTIASRILQAVFYAGTVVLCFLFAREWFGLASARVTALLLGTCSGFVPFKIFLTADMSLVFWMTACLYMSGRIMRDPGSIRVSLLAGACAGFATATKYNGLGIAIVLPLAHFLAPGGFTGAWRRRSFYLCGLAVPAAFILANPYCLFDWRRFAQDFMYNYTVTPVYGGQTGYGYGIFMRHIPSLIGQPLSWILPAVALAGLWPLGGKGGADMRRAMVLLMAALLLYFCKIGGFPRIEARFVLPVAPLIFLIACPGWQLLSRRQVILASLVVPLCLYGLASGWYVGNIFAQDARMSGIDWARQNFPPEARVESAGHCPKWQFLEDRKIEVTSFPQGVTRSRIFRENLADNEWVARRLARNIERNDPKFLTPEALSERKPNFITVDSFYLSDFDAAPFMRRLLSGELGYRIVFEQQTPLPPEWVYPQQPDFTCGTFYILGRK
ncbi:MAG: glycosyltransferase family 39 protein [Chthoniobacterales bacterium]|nr:glycosyltransferase family 39 protein [Chthoniobacterales bacterium]